jgi:hypothetical protein
MKLPFFPVLFQQEACESRLYAHHRALTSLSGVLTKTVSSRQQTTKVVADHWSHNQSLQLLVPNQLLGRLRSYQHLNTNSNTWIGPLETALLVSGCDQLISLCTDYREDCGRNMLSKGASVEEMRRAQDAALSYVQQNILPRMEEWRFYLAREDEAAWSVMEFVFERWQALRRSDGSAQIGITSPSACVLTGRLHTWWCGRTRSKKWNDGADMLACSQMEMRCVLSDRLPLRNKQS